VTDDAALAELLEAGLQDGVAPALSAWVAMDFQPRALAAAGAATPETVFDLASLTKPQVIVHQVMTDVAQGRYDLHDEAVRLGDSSLSFYDLLGHRAGLPAWDDLWHVAQDLGSWEPGSEAVWRAVERRCGALLTERPEASVVYSDLGFILLGRELERRHGKSLRELSTIYGPAATAAPTGPCPRRGRDLMGEVHDLNCWVLGGAAGHAGGFGTAADVGQWALDLARSAAGLGGKMDGAVVREFWSRDHRTSDATWVLGWDTPSATGSSGGALMSDQAISHLGFTGTSVWIDPAVGMVAVLLTNRVAGHADSQSRIRTFRPWFHDQLREVFAGA
jgi:CubicO group peptidase (beta-lactamase class C family)